MRGQSTRGQLLLRIEMSMRLTTSHCSKACQKKHWPEHRREWRNCIRFENSVHWPWRRYSSESAQSQRTRSHASSNSRELNSVRHLSYRTRGHDLRGLCLVQTVVSPTNRIGSSAEFRLRHKQMHPAFIKNWLFKLCVEVGSMRSNGYWNIDVSKQVALVKS